MIKFEVAHTSISRSEMKCVKLLEDKEITWDRSANQEVFLNEFIDAGPYGNYHTSGIGTYVIFDEDQPIPNVKGPAG